MEFDDGLGGASGATPSDAGKWERWWRQLVEDTTEGMECLPACDSYAHDEFCPVTNPLAAWRQLRQRLAELESQRAASPAVAASQIAETLRGVPWKEIVRATWPWWPAHLVESSAERMAEAVRALYASRESGRAPGEHPVGDQPQGEER